MSVTERVMVAGAWAVDLAPETPGQLMEQIALSRAGFAQIEILPAHLDPREHSDETLLGLARYTGLYRSQEGTYRLSGPGLPVLLGDEEGKADIAETAISTPNGWLSQWVPALRPITLRSGTVTSPGGAYTGTFRLKNRKEAFEILNDAFGVEWRIRPTLHLDVGPPSALYGSVPQLLILRNAGSGGRDLSPLPAAPTSVQTLTGVVVEDADWDEDLENYTTKTIYATGEEGAEVLTTATTSDADIPYGRGIAAADGRRPAGAVHRDPPRAAGVRRATGCRAAAAGRRTRVAVRAANSDGHCQPNPVPGADGLADHVPPARDDVADHPRLRRLPAGVALSASAARLA